MNLSSNSPPSESLLIADQVDRQVRGLDAENAAVVGFRVQEQVRQPPVQSDRDVTPAVHPGVLPVLGRHRVAVVADLHAAPGRRGEASFGGPLDPGAEDDPRIGDDLVVPVPQVVGRGETGDPVRRLPPPARNDQRADHRHQLGRPRRVRRPRSRPGIRRPTRLSGNGASRVNRQTARTSERPPARSRANNPISGITTGIELSDDVADAGAGQPGGHLPPRLAGALGVGDECGDRRLVERLGER